MHSIAFIDTEIDPKSKKILDIGAVNTEGKTLHTKAIPSFIHFLQGAAFICGHNIFKHDLQYIQPAVNEAGVSAQQIIDTLYLSPLLFPQKPYHALLKDDKLQTEELNNPVNDSLKAKDLFYDELNAFRVLDAELQAIYFLLLNKYKEFHAFFRMLNFTTTSCEPEKLIAEKFETQICKQAPLSEIVQHHPVELAYALALIHCAHRYSITPPWVLRNYPQVERVMCLLRNKPCLTGCQYCNQALNIFKALKDYFGYDSYRTYAGEAMQQQAVQAAVDNKSLLAIFPTGGGKSITFQVPALMAGESMKGLTVVISPLQSLMKDQVDNLENNQITKAVTINGLLDPIERQKAIERVQNGDASLLYISPESLRSKTIEKILQGRKIVRFVIDEAHCFSAWGQDFRVDYLYIGDFIKSFQESKNLSDPIPVSCFTATAKQKVIEDICIYFKEKLQLDLEIFPSKATRTNLAYKVHEKGNDEEKYSTVRELIEINACPTIIYVSRTRRARELATRLTEDGLNARAYHGKMESKEKSKNQEAFIKGDVQIMVATSAFGMGVDKKDVGMVIHYEISDSLENYVQEAGRAGRDENMNAVCYVLFNEEDLSKHFILLNKNKINLNEIKQIWQALKFLTKFKPDRPIQKSALEIARVAGWDENVPEIETRVITAIAALEEAGYIKRKQNVPKVFANSIMSKTAQEAIDKITMSVRFNEGQKLLAKRIIKSLFSSKSRKQTDAEDAEARIDYISDNLGIAIKDVIAIVQILREEKILADAKDLKASIRNSEQKNRSLAITETYRQIEHFLCPLFEEEERSFHIKELNEEGEKSGCVDISPNKIKTVLNFWAIKNWIKRHSKDSTKNQIVAIANQSPVRLKERLEKRHVLANFIVNYLFDKCNASKEHDMDKKEESLVEFSILELKEAYENPNQLFDSKASNEEIEDTLFYLSRIDAIKIEGGFLVIYNKLTIDRLEQNNNVQYKKQDYQKLSDYYDHKVQQIHIVGEYAKKMIDDDIGALKFVDDYFHLNFSSFISKYFKGSRALEISRNITPAKYRQLFDSLSETQRRIIDDKTSRYIVVAAGPGSGKTKVLVHKLASLLLMEDVKHDQLLMLTFSRASATEFKKRLIALIGNAAHFVDIKTFHSYCFDLLGKVGTIDQSASVIKTAIDKIKSGEVENSRITKTVLVIDEAQDMDQYEFELIDLLISRNEEMRVIAVGDDDQNIYEWRGAHSKYMLSFITLRKATKYELVTNYRSKSNLVSFTNQYVRTLQQRLKQIPIEANQQDDGKIRIIKYESKNLVIPLVDHILKDSLSGTTCILTHTNKQAFEVAGLLAMHEARVKLIQSNERFSLVDLAELRYFIDELHLDPDTYKISDDIWENAKRKFVEKYKASTKFEIPYKIINDFEGINKKNKYRSDFEVFIRESRLEDFMSPDGETIFVSTIHKAKGKEFDNLYLLLDQFDDRDDKAKREIYVAITRAKKNLVIHVNRSTFDHLQTNDLQRSENNTVFHEPIGVTLHLHHTDLYLSYFKYTQKQVEPLMSGDRLYVSEEGCKDNNGQKILKFSKKFLDEIAEHKTKGYELKGAKINFIVYWTDEKLNQELKIVLPEIYLEKKHASSGIH